MKTYPEATETTQSITEFFDAATTEVEPVKWKTSAAATAGIILTATITVFFLAVLPTAQWVIRTVVSL